MHGRAKCTLHEARDENCFWAPLDAEYNLAVKDLNCDFKSSSEAPGAFEVIMEMD